MCWVEEGWLAVERLTFLRRRLRWLNYCIKHEAMKTDASSPCFQRNTIFHYMNSFPQWYLTLSSCLFSEFTKVNSKIASALVKGLLKCPYAALRCILNFTLYIIKSIAFRRLVLKNLPGEPLILFCNINKEKCNKKSLRGRFWSLNFIIGDFVIFI